MLDSAAAISKEYGVPLEEILPHVADLLNRFRNQSLGDTCQRVGAVYRYLSERDMEQTAEQARTVLKTISGLEQDHPAMKLVLKMYQSFLNGDPPAVMRRIAQDEKSEYLLTVVLETLLVFCCKKNTHKNNDIVSLRKS